MGRPAEALALAESAKRADARQPGSWEAEGLLHDREGRDGESRVAYEKAVELGSTSFWAHYRLAQLSWSPALDDERARRIAALLETAVRLSPAFADGWSYLADIRLSLGETDEALEHARHAVRLAPHESHHRLVAARIYRGAQQPAEARAAGRAALALAADEQERKNAQDFLDSLPPEPD
jgi:tetratricopeptide (TPR) repeat protein